MFSFGLFPVNISIVAFPSPSAASSCDPGKLSCVGQVAMGVSKISCLRGPAWLRLPDAPVQLDFRLHDNRIVLLEPPGSTALFPEYSGILWRTDVFATQVKLARRYGSSRYTKPLHP